jgi:hypothetical protein
MLMDLKRELKEGDTVPIELVVEERGGRRQVVEVRAQVRPFGARGAHGH